MSTPPTGGQALTITCYEINHDGEGGRGQQYECPARVQAACGYAEDAAGHFDGLEIRMLDIAESDLDGTSRVIEVVGLPGGPRRFKVWTRIKRYYESTEEPDA